MRKTILITGASSGIGEACCKVAYRENLNVIATARRKSKLKQLQKELPRLQIIIADISTETGRNIIAQSINIPLDFMLHNAAVLDPPQNIVDLKISDFRNNIITNAEPIIFLTQKLLLQFKKASKKARILSISSGAAKTAISGLGNYCMSKATALMANQVLKAELPMHGIIVNDYFPGVVNTTMQKTLRSATTDIFPYASEFKKLNDAGKLSNPIDVANDLIRIFTKTTEQLFIESEWMYRGTNTK